MFFGIRSPNAENIISQDRFTAVKINNWLLITMYMPCAGTAQRELLYDDVLYELQALINQYPSCDCLIGGDFNVDLDNDITRPISRTVNTFNCKNKLHRCDQITPVGNKMTFVNENANVCSAIDYDLSSSHDKIVALNILDVDINFSDHLPLMVICGCDIPISSTNHGNLHQSPDTLHFWWDHAPLHLFYEHTLLQFQPVLEELDWLLRNLCSIDDVTVTLTINQIYEKVVAKLRESANLFIPKHKTNFCKF